MILRLMHGSRDDLLASLVHVSHGPPSSSALSLHCRGRREFSQHNDAGILTASDHHRHRSHHTLLLIDLIERGGPVSALLDRASGGSAEDDLGLSATYTYALHPAPDTRTNTSRLCCLLPLSWVLERAPPRWRTPLVREDDIEGRR